MEARGQGRRARVELTLKEKVSVLEYAKHHPDHGSRQIAKAFDCGKTQIQSILKSRDAIVKDFQECCPSSRKRKRESALNDAVYNWFSLARQRGVPVTGPMLQDEALKIAVAMGESEFKASNGWLENFKKRRGIAQFTISGEAASVPDELVDSWKERLSELLLGCDDTEVWNADETACFFRALPNKTLGQKKQKCSGGKQSKERITVVHFASAAGEKLPPVIIGRSEKPRCFKSVRDIRRPCGIPYYSNSKAWMTRDIWKKMLTAWNAELERCGKKVVLLADNAPTHDPSLKLSNVTIIFLPKNATSRVQPLDAGIIKNFKVMYRRLLLQHVLALIDQTTLSASEIAKSVDLLTAIRFVKRAWNDVQRSTIRNCFRSSGAIPKQEEDVDPFEGLEDDAENDESELQGLIDKISPEIVSGAEYAAFDDDVETCYTIEGDDWKEKLRVAAIENLAKRSTLQEKEVVSDAEEEEEDDETERSQIDSWGHALFVAMNLQMFANERKNEEVSEAAFELSTRIKEAKLKSIVSTKQAKIDQYFQKND